MVVELLQEVWKLARLVGDERGGHAGAWSCVTCNCDGTQQCGTSPVQLVLVQLKLC
jgi:hypothetical protein